MDVCILVNERVGGLVISIHNRPYGAVWIWADAQEQPRNNVPYVDDCFLPSCLRRQEIKGRYTGEQLHAKADERSGNKYASQKSDGGEQDRCFRDVVHGMLVLHDATL
jgi:hypothetical protein